MALAPPGVRRDPDAKPTNRGLWLTFHDEHQERFRRLGNITLEGVKNSSKGSGATPEGSLARPHGTSKKRLYPSASARTETRGLLSRVSARGTLTNAHDESTHTKLRSPTRRPPVARTIINVHSLEHGKSVVRIDWGSTKRRPSNTETGSYESKGLERKDAARRLTRAQELGHLMRLPRSHLT